MNAIDVAWLFILIPAVLWITVDMLHTFYKVLGRKDMAWDFLFMIVLFIAWIVFVVATTVEVLKKVGII